MSRKVSNAIGFTPAFHLLVTHGIRSAALAVVFAQSNAESAFNANIRDILPYGILLCRVPSSRRRILVASCAGHILQVCESRNRRTCMHVNV